MTALYLLPRSELYPKKKRIYSLNKISQAVFLITYYIACNLDVPIHIYFFSMQLRYTAFITEKNIINALTVLRELPDYSFLLYIIIIIIAIVK